MLRFFLVFFFFSSRRRHTRWTGDWSSDVCSSDLRARVMPSAARAAQRGSYSTPTASRPRWIGRASCRKSVDLGGRRIIKKKKTKKKKKQKIMKKKKKIRKNKKTNK